MPAKTKEANREHQRRWYEKNKELQKERNRSNREKKFAWFYEYKKNLKCERCGETHIATLDFHHRDPSEKEYALHRMIYNNHSMEKIKAEIAKCEVLCSNCHRKHHYEEKTGAWCNGSTRDL